MFTKKVSTVLINGRNVVTCVSLLALSVLLSSCMGPIAVDPIVEARMGLESADSVMGDWEGSWPSTLSCGGAHPFSRYMDIMPRVKVTAPGVNGYSPEGEEVYYLERNSGPDMLGIGWAYDSATGNLYVNSTALDSKGVSYSTYGNPTFGPVN